MPAKKLEQKEKARFLFYEGQRPTSDGYGFISGKTRLHLSEQAYYLCVCMDGKTPYKELKRKFERRYGLRLARQDFEKFVRQLEENGLLADKVNGYLRSKLHYTFTRKEHKRFAQRKIREPSYAGICYKGDPKELEKDLKRCFSSVNKYNLAALLRGIKRLKGIIVPHSNIELSGPCAAWAYQAQARMSSPELFIILSPDHSLSLRYPFSVLLKDFRMPMGVVKVDKEFAKRLAKKCSFNIFASSFAHAREHAIEMQLPFLQYLFRKNQERLKIVPILCAKRPHKKGSKSKFKVYQEQFIQALKRVILGTGKSIVCIATGDLIHIKGWGPQDKFHQENKEIVHSLKRADAEEFKQNLRLKKYGICGRPPFYTLLRILEPARAKVLNYSWTSNSKFVKRKRKSEQYDSLVEIGYASMVFY